MCKARRNVLEKQFETIFQKFIDHSSEFLNVYLDSRGENIIVMVHKDSPL